MSTLPVLSDSELDAVTGGSLIFASLTIKNINLASVTQESANVGGVAFKNVQINSQSVSIAQSA